MKKLVVFGIFAVFLGTVFSAFLMYQNFQVTGAAEDDSEVVYEVTQGKVFSKVTAELLEMGLIRNGTLFNIYARIKGEASKLKVGEYALRKNMTPGEILAVITSGKSIGHPFTVAEGLTIYEISDLYAEKGFGTKEDFMNAVTDPEFIKGLLGQEYETLEGYLFPETYQITKFTSTKELIQNMVRRYQEVYKEVIAQSQIQGLSEHQIVTLASIVEKETGLPEDRTKISSVFHNRLNKGMMLQTDPTIIYGLAQQTGKIIPKISKSDITNPTKYNTYTFKGLPPGPISNPGRAALLATVQPEKTDYLFFVSRNDGTTAFTVELGDHNKAVQKFQKDAKAREGKSWRDSMKKTGN